MIDSHSIALPVYDTKVGGVSGLKSNFRCGLAHFGGGSHDFIHKGGCVVLADQSFDRDRIVVHIAQKLGPVLKGAFHKLGHTECSLPTPLRLAI